MRIIVCLKQVLTPGTVPRCSDGQLGYNPRAGLVLNPFDGCALEAALRLRANYGGTVEALTLGEQEAVPVLREALAMGADQAIHVVANTRNLNNMQVAYWLAASIRRLNIPNLILTGKESTIFGSGAVGPILAEYLNMPHIAYSRSITIQGQVVRVERSRETVLETLESEFPLLLTISREIGEPRSPTVREVLAARKVLIPTIDGSELDIDEKILNEDLSDFENRDCIPVPARNSGEILTGSIEEQVNSLCQKLIMEGILPERRDSCVCK